MSLRARLTLWYTAFFAILTLAIAMAVYLRVHDDLLDGTEEFLDESLSAFGGELHSEAEMFRTLPSAIARALEDVQFREVQISVFDSAHGLLGTRVPRSQRAHFRQPNSDDGLLPLDMSLLADSVRALPDPDGPTFYVRDVAGGYMVHVHADTLFDVPLRLVSTYPMHELAETLAALRRDFLLIFPIVLLLSAGGGYMLARRSLMPLRAMSRRARRITSMSLHERVIVPTSRDEVGELGSVINNLLERLEGAFEQQRRFISDASHELRTPVAQLRAECDVTLARTHRSEEEYRDAIGAMRAAARRLERIVSDLLLLVQADHVGQVAQRDPVYLDEVFVEICRSMRRSANEHGVTLRLGRVDEAPLQGDEELLTRLVSNLVDNAIKYSGSGATVDASLVRSRDSYVISVVDNGPGIPEEAQPHVFERFFRANAERLRGRDERRGTGLGLSIAQWVAHAHDGELELVDSRPGHTEFRATLPRSAKSLAVRDARGREAPTPDGASVS